jgi:hypothetical protein
MIRNTDNEGDFPMNISSNVVTQETRGRGEGGREHVVRTTSDD